VTTIETPTSIQAADTLDKAADHIDRVGHHKGYLYDEKQAKGSALEDCRVCAVGSILAAAYGKPRFPAEEPEENVTDLAIDALIVTVGGPVPPWNDDPKRQKRQVVKALRDTAARLRDEVPA
jgi:hypothetical protein